MRGFVSVAAVGQLSGWQSLGKPPRSQGVASGCLFLRYSPKVKAGIT